MTYEELLVALDKLKRTADADASLASERIEKAKSRAVRFSSERDSQPVLVARQLQYIMDDVELTMKVGGYK